MILKNIFYEICIYIYIIFQYEFLYMFCCVFYLNIQQIFSILDLSCYAMYAQVSHTISFMTCIFASVLGSLCKELLLKDRNIHLYLTYAVLVCISVWLQQSCWCTKEEPRCVMSNFILNSMWMYCCALFTFYSNPFVRVVTDTKIFMNKLRELSRILWTFWKLLGLI